MSSARWLAPRGKKGASALAIDRLTKRFGGCSAFRDVSFEVSGGEVFGPAVIWAGADRSPAGD